MEGEGLEICCLFRSVRIVPSSGDEAREANLCVRCPHHPPSLPFDSVAGLGHCGLQVRVKGHGFQRGEPARFEVDFSVVILRLEVHITLNKTSNFPENKVPAPLEGREESSVGGSCWHESWGDPNSSRKLCLGSQHLFPASPFLPLVPGFAAARQR